MTMRRTAPLLFAVLCLGLSALVLRRQITAHPPPSRPVFLPGPLDPSGSFDSGRPIDLRTWHVAAGPARQAVQTAIAGQLAAIRSGDADKAWFYQSRGLHRNFPTAQAFVETITRGYPEFGHARSVALGPVWTDPTGDHADVTVTVRGENGRLARGFYRLVREQGRYKVAGVEGGRPIR